jgi:chromosome segregation ATPase
LKLKGLSALVFSLKRRRQAEAARLREAAVQENEKLSEAHTRTASVEQLLNTTRRELAAMKEGSAELLSQIAALEKQCMQVLESLLNVKDPIAIPIEC